jgi:hypothetical protein
LLAEAQHVDRVVTVDPVPFGALLAGGKTCFPSKKQIAFG